MSAVRCVLFTFTVVDRISVRSIAPSSFHPHLSLEVVLLSFFSLSYRGARTIHALQIANLAFPLTDAVDEHARHHMSVIT